MTVSNALRWALPMALLTLTPAQASAQSIKRHGETGSRILDSVSVPGTATTLYLSGQVASPVKGSDVATTTFGDTRTQTGSVLAKIETLLAKRGYSMRDVIKLTIFLVGDPALGGRMDFAGMNAGFDQYFRTAGNPATVARSTVQVSALAAPGYLVEIEATAAKAP